MKATIKLNSKNELAIFYEEDLGFIPEWASIDGSNAEIFIGSHESEDSKLVKLNPMTPDIIQKIASSTDILVVETGLVDDEMQPIKAVWCSLMVVQET